jgi:hypothetical protein
VKELEDDPQVVPRPVVYEEESECDSKIGKSPGKSLTGIRRRAKQAHFLSRKAFNDRSIFFGMIVNQKNMQIFSSENM